MARRLVTNGVRVPPGLVQAADQYETALAQGKPIEMASLAGTHERLARLVAPAKPGTLYLLDDSVHQRGGEPSSLGPVKLVRDMVRVALVCVGIFIVLSVMAIVDAHPTVEVFGRDLVILEIILERVFWLAAAGIGASFAMLFQLNEQIVSRTFDPDEAASYWVKFFLGLVAGFILVALVPMEAAQDADGAKTSAQALGPPTIALLGGFSASAVYRILTRMVEALESVFAGGAKEQAAAAEKAATTRANEESSQGRMAVAGQLVDLQRQLSAGMEPHQAAGYIKQMLTGLVPTAFELPESSPPAQGGAPAPEAAPAPAPEPEPDKVPALAVVSAPADAPAADPAPAEAAAPQPAPAG